MIWSIKLMLHCVLHLDFLFFMLYHFAFGFSDVSDLVDVSNFVSAELVSLFNFCSHPFPLTPGRCFLAQLFS
jgi:hypothetical protein